MIAIPNCPYCEEPCDGPVTNGLHNHCNQALHEELAIWEENMLFSGVLNWQDSEGHLGTIGEFKNIEAVDKAQAERIVLDEFWDHRLDSACCSPIIVFEE